MPVILYTNERFDVGSVFDTRDYCDLNRRALEDASDEEREVEEFLEAVRQEHFQGAPDRVCAIVGILVPSTESRLRRREGDAPVGSPVPEPAGIGAHCYHIREAPGATHLIADEAFVGKLVDHWSEVRGRFDKYRIAQSYWSGEVLSGYSILIRGPVLVEAECRWPAGGRRFKPVVWGAD